MKKILLINGHPDKDSFNFSLSDAYIRGVHKSKADLKSIFISSLKFDPNLQFGYRKRTTLEPDLIEAQEKILWADHLVFFYPVWWGSLPAILKGFIDRVFLPGFAMQHHKNSVWWDKLLTGKSARIICTMDQPNWYYRIFFRQPSHEMMKRTVLMFCGINPVRITSLGPVNISSKKQREKWLVKVEKMGRLNL